ncbi:MAG TPA: peptidyl-prolyl cis-trans isomerase [Candidatus Methylomirabilis sp.]|nr:peptidyl-prolyl cis-trans isomerase [Candidatus Methylomirabilis sp.]
MKWMRLVVTAGCGLALAACGRGGGDGKSPVVLQVNEKTYTAADVEREITQEFRSASPQVQQFLTGKEGQKQFLERLVRRELLLQEAEKRKLGDRTEVVDPVAALRRDLMTRVLLQEEIGNKVKVEEKDVQDYFNAHPDEFSGDQIRVRHILVRTEDEAKQVLDRLGKNERFEDLAKALSQDSATAPKGGDLDYLKREQLFPEFARAAFELKAGEVSGVVRTPFGYHIIKLVDRKKGQPLKYEQIKEQLQRRLLEERRTQRFQQWMKELEATAKITRDESALPVGKAAPPPPGQGGPGSAAPVPQGGDKT